VRLSHQRLPDMVIERPDGEELPEVGDPIRRAIYPLIELVMELTPSGSPQRTAAMNEILAAAIAASRVASS
jgi:hypothetical protein